MKNRAMSVISAGSSVEKGTSKWAVAALSVAVIAAIAVWSNLWLLDPRNFFRADDWAWIGFSEFADIREFLNLLPNQLYNDRPVGALVIRGMHHLFGLNYPAFQASLLALHAVNSAALFFIARRYLPLTGSFTAAALSALWFCALSAVGWVAAIFDLLGATLCLSAILLRHASLNRGGDLRWNIAGALAYLLAVRTKEYAIGLIAVLFLMELLCERRRRMREMLAGLWPYLVVFAIYMATYLRLYAISPAPAGELYRLHFSALDLVKNLWFYVSTALYQDSVGEQWAIAAVVGLLVLAALGAWRRNWTAVWGITGFVILLGPTLLLTKHLDPLYLYAPHFFLALAIGAGFSAGILGRIIALALTALVILASTTTEYRFNIIKFMLAKTEMIQSQFRFAEGHLAGTKDKTTVVVSGVEPYFNVFSYGPGDSMNIWAGRQKQFKLVLEKPVAELDRDFCQATGAKRYFHFDALAGSDVTAEKMRKCAAPHIQ